MCIMRPIKPDLVMRPGVGKRAVIKMLDAPRPARIGNAVGGIGAGGLQRHQSQPGIVDLMRASKPGWRKINAVFRADQRTAAIGAGADLKVAAGNHQWRANLVGTRLQGAGHFGRLSGAETWRFRPHDAGFLFGNANDVRA